MNEMRKLMEAVGNHEPVYTEFRDPDGNFIITYSHSKGYRAKGIGEYEDQIPNDSFNTLDDAANHAELCRADLNDYNDDGQPSEYQEWQDFEGGDDWDHGQYDESIEHINEDPTVGGNMHELQRKLTELESFAETLYWNYEKYPQLKEHQALLQEVMTQSQVLRRKVFGLR